MILTGTIYNGLVSRISVKNTQALNNDARMVRLLKETLCNNSENEAWFGNLNSNNSVVLVRNIKCSYSISQLERAEHFLRPKLSIFGEIFCFATKPHRLQQLLLSISSNGLGNKTVIS